VRAGRYEEVEDENEVRNAATLKSQKLNSYAEMCDNIEFLYEQKVKREIEKSGRNLDDERKGVDKLLSQKKERKIKKDKSKRGGQLRDSVNVGHLPEVDLHKLKASSKWFDKNAFDVVVDQEADTQCCNSLPPVEIHSKTQANINVPDDSADDSSEFEQEEEREFEDLDAPNAIDLKRLNDDDLAEIVVISKKMLRKKARREMVDASYNRYNYPEDPATLPKWFADEERRHTGKTPNVSKAEIDAEKERIYLLRNQLPKKVMEAKYRKKKKVVREMKKAETEVKQIFDEDNVNFSRAKQISEIYKRAIRKSKEKPKRIVFMKKQFSGAPRKKSGRKFLVVDKRGKKDLRNDKYRKKGHN
jgi:AdoMet-dependent rRNA methyltransferase SPB1